MIDWLVLANLTNGERDICHLSQGVDASYDDENMINCM
jgi:hypothetical protein